MEYEWAKIITTRDGKVHSFAHLAPIRWPINVVFEGVGSLRPMDDITPQEAVHLCMLLVCGITPCSTNVDFIRFVEEHGLQRHFTAK